MQKQYHIAVIGGGASGLLAAIAALSFWNEMTALVEKFFQQGTADAILGIL